MQKKNFATGVRDKWDSEYETARNTISNGINRARPYCFITDETPCRWDDISVTNLLMVQNICNAPKTLDIQLREAAQDNEGIKNLCFDATTDYSLPRDLCSAVAFDSAAYNVAAWNGMRSYFRLAVPIFDPIHKIATAMKQAYEDDDWQTVKIWHQKSRCIFKNSIQRRRQFKSYLAEKEPIRDAGSLGSILRQLLPAQIEEVLDEPVMHYDEEDAGVVVEALNKAVSYNAIPPKLISGLQIYVYKNILCLTMIQKIYRKI